MSAPWRLWLAIGCRCDENVCTSTIEYTCRLHPGRKLIMRSKAWNQYAIDYIWHMTYERRSCVLCYLLGKSWQRCLSHRQRTREDSEPRLRCRLRPAQVTTKIAVSLSFCFSDVYKTDKAEREAERHKLTYLYCHQYDWWNMIGCLFNVTFSTNRLYRAIGTWNISLRTRRQEKHNKMMKQYTKPKKSYKHSSARALWRGSLHHG